MRVLELHYYLRAMTMNGGKEMALTRSFKELVQKRVASDPGFGEALRREGINTMLAGCNRTTCSRTDSAL